MDINEYGGNIIDAWTFRKELEAQKASRKEHLRLMGEMITEFNKNPNCPFIRPWIIKNIQLYGGFQSILHYARQPYYIADFIKEMDTWPETALLIRQGVRYWGNDPSLRMVETICKGQ